MHSDGRPLLEIQDLRRPVPDRARRSSRAVDGLDLTVRRGEILGIAGESGCGKSTLAAALLRLVRPPGFVAGGSVLFYPAGGEPVDLLTVNDARLRQIRWRHLSYVPQGSMNSLNPVTRVLDQFKDAILQHARRAWTRSASGSRSCCARSGWRRASRACSRTSCPAG